MADRDIKNAEMAAELETRCNIDLDTAKEEASWYSVMNILAASLGSGMGIPLEETEIASALGNVGLCPAELTFESPVLLKALFKSADPSLLKPFLQKNMDTWRWSSDSFDRTLVPQAQGWSIIAETECARWFGLPEKDETIPADFRKEWMINSLLMAASARAQCAYAFENLTNDEGLFVMASQPGSVTVEQSECNMEDQACMLWASSDAALLAGRIGSVLSDEEMRRSYTAYADGLFESIVKNKESLMQSSANHVQAKSILISALIWYAAVTEKPDLKASCLWLMREYADDLVRAADANEMVGNSIVDAAAALRALTDAFRITRLRTYADSAAQIFNWIESQWWKLPGVYSQSPLTASSEYTYNSDHVGIIIGALNAARIFLRERINQQLSELRMRIFFCNAVNLSGMQMSMPSMDMLPAWLMQREPTMHFRHNNVPYPSEAGSGFGVAPVFAGEVAYDPQSDTWSRRMIFDVSAAMHACCEFMWLNYKAINGFPDIRLENAPAAVRQAVGM